MDYGHLKAFRACFVDDYFLILYSLSAGSRVFQCAKPPHDVHLLFAFLLIVGGYLTEDMCYTRSFLSTIEQIVHN